VGTRTVFAHLYMASATVVNFLLTVSKDLSNLSWHSLLADWWVQVQMYIPKASTEVHLSVAGRPNGSSVSCKCMKASRVMHKLSKHLVWSTRVSCIHWAPDSLGMGQGGFTSGLCCDRIPFKRMTAAFAKVTVLGPSLDVSLYDDSSVLLIMLPAKGQKLIRL